MILNLIQHRRRIFNKPFSYILYCCRPNPSPNDLHFFAQLKVACPHIIIHYGFPNFKNVSFIPGEKMVVLDDLMLEIIDNKDMFNAITQASNHHSISILMTSQNYFQTGKYYKTLHRNTTEKFILLDKGEKRWLSSLSNQMYPLELNFLPNVMNWIREHIEGSYNHYFVVSSNPKSILPDSMSVKTKIFPNEATGLIEPIYFTSNK